MTVRSLDTRAVPDLGLTATGTVLVHLNCSF
ncbi:MAG: hypothetical protein RIS36_1298 [Pseudomonadota bacterium]|jgi:hypothetical protein